MSVLRDSSKVLTGLAVQRIVSFIMIPVIARLLGPKNYGIFCVAASICAFLSVFGTLALESSIAVAATERQAAERTIGVNIIGLLIGFLFFIASYLMHPFLRDYYSDDITDALLIMIPIFVPLGIFNASLQNYVGYLKKFTFFSMAEIISPLTGYTGLILVYFLFWRDYRCLIASGIISFFSKVKPV